MIKHIKHIFAEFEHGIDKWDEPRERLFEGNMVKGRPTRGFGDASFEYAGKLYEPEPWSHEIKLIKIAAEKIASKQFKRDIEFTFCLCGYYSDQGEGIPHHTDTVPKLKDVVFSVSFGAPRVFEWSTYEYIIKDHTNTSDSYLKNSPWKSYSNPPMGTSWYLLEHGDAIMFDGHSQMTSTHAIPELIGAGERINLTFRSGL